MKTPVRFCCGVLLTTRVDLFSTPGLIVPARVATTIITVATLLNAAPGPCGRPSSTATQLSAVTINFAIQPSMAR